MSLNAIEDQPKMKAGETANIECVIDQIHLTKDGLFVRVDRHFYPIRALFEDGTGRYLCDIDWWDEEDLRWLSCWRCGHHYNSMVADRCPNCGAVN